MIRIYFRKKVVQLRGGDIDARFRKRVLKLLFRQSVVVILVYVLKQLPQLLLCVSNKGRELWRGCQWRCPSVPIGSVPALILYASVPIFIKGFYDLIE